MLDYQETRLSWYPLILFLKKNVLVISCSSSEMLPGRKHTQFECERHHSGRKAPVRNSSPLAGARGGIFRELALSHLPLFSKPVGGSVRGEPEQCQISPILVACSLAIPRDHRENSHPN